MSSDLVKNTDEFPREVNTRQLSGVQRLLEAGLLFFSVFAMFLMLALFSFDPADPGWAQTGYQTPVRNLGGAVGAYLSDLLLNLFGLIAYSLPFVVAIVGWLLFQRYHQLMKLDYLTLGLKLIGFFMLYLGVTSIASMNFDDIFYFSAGGIVGDVLSQTLLPYFSFVGSTLIFLLFTCAGFVLLTGFSWLKFIDAIGHYTIAGFMYLIALPKTIKENFGTSATNEEAPAESADIDAIAQIEDSKTLAKSEQTPEKALEKASEESTVEQPVIDTYDAHDNEPFVDIEELLTEPLDINVQEHVSEAEIAAAFANVDQPDVADDIDFSNHASQVEPQHKPITQHIEQDNGQVNLVAEPEETFQGMPSIDLLDRPDKAQNPVNQEELDQVSRLVEAKLLDFGVKAQVVSVYPGPVITRFELDLAPGVKVSKITSLSKDLARALSAISVRVVESYPG